MKKVLAGALLAVCAASLSAAGATKVEPAGLPALLTAFRPAPLVRVTTYQLQPGDTVTSVAKAAGIAVETVLSYNQIKSPRTLRAGQVLNLPSFDGIVVHIDTPTPVNTLAVNYKVFPSLLLLANQLPEGTPTLSGNVFLPGVKLPSAELRKALGEWFAWPTVGGRISSFFGRRNDPFTGQKTLHSGVDIANFYGAPVLAAGDGRVVATGYDSVLGNYIRVDQGQGFVSVYGHLSAILTKEGRKVRAGQLIGKVGSTGYSTGPHLHFSAYRWNRLLNPMTLFG